jgi:hypothetical protein
MYQASIIEVPNLFQKQWSTDTYETMDEPGLASIDLQHNSTTGAQDQTTTALVGT